MSMSIDFAFNIDTEKFNLANEARTEGGRKNFPSLGVKLTPKIASHDWSEKDGRLTLVISRVNGEFEEHHFEKQGSSELKESSREELIEEAESLIKWFNNPNLIDELGSKSAGEKLAELGKNAKRLEVLNLLLYPNN